MQNYFYRDKAGQEIGPLALDALAKLRFAGVLDGDTPVRVADSAEWKPCREIIADPAHPLPAQIPTEQPAAKSPLSPVLIALVIVGALVYGGMTLYKSVAAKTTLTYDFSVDGNELSALQRPEVKVDGQLFESGDHLKPGRHQISVSLENVEPYERHFWVFHGDKDLGKLPLVASKGSLSVTVNPSPATVTVFLQREREVVRQGDAPLNADKLPVGNYTLIIRRGEYEETHSAKIQREQQTKMQVDLDLGSVDLSSDPADAEFDLSGKGRHWEGKLPTKIEEVPGGNYSLVVSRKGWELNNNISVTRGEIATQKVEFPYGSIEVTSDPTGMTVLTNGVEIGKTPMTLQELIPGQYTLTVSSGEGDLKADVSVAAKEAAKHTFTFHYGLVQLASRPTGATVIRKGKEIGKTPMTLQRVLVGESSVELRRDGYASTNITIVASEGETAEFSVSLVSKLYLQVIEMSQDALAAGQIQESKRDSAAAVVINNNQELADDAGDPAALHRMGDIYRDILRDLAKADEYYKKADAANEAIRKQKDEESKIKEQADKEQRFNRNLAMAEKGQLGSMIIVGKCYRDGDGVEKDLSKARAWFQKASDEGSSEAIQLLFDLNK